MFKLPIVVFARCKYIYTLIHYSFIVIANFKKSCRRNDISATFTVFVYFASVKRYRNEMISSRIN